MRLKRLKLFGFKSFADVSVVEFIEGITAVVGPNGCGKSNIADAFRWVLGEQSAKSLRGRSMPDVIFAGTTTRKPLNYAEVSLTLTEVNGQLPIEYDEVTITRRLHRSGDSEYFINTHPVRYREVQSLFMDSGIGRSAFSIFEQGKIDQVINLSPFERRYLFEEAAGILRFLQRKKEALRKLEETEQNRERLTDLHQEVSRQVEVLAAQAEDARHYKAKKSELEALQTAVLCARWAWLDLQMRQLEDRERSKIEGVAGSQEALTGYQAACRQAREALVQAEHRLSLQRQEIVKVQTTIEHTVESRSKHRERLDEALTAQQRKEKELIELLATRSARKEEAEADEARLEEIRDRLADAEAALQGRRKQFSAREERMSALWQQQQQLQQEQLRMVQAEAKLEGDLSQSLAFLNTSQQRLTQLELEREALRQKAEGLDEVVVQREGALQAISGNLEAAKERLEALSAAKEALQHQSTLKEQELQRVSQQLTQAQARYQALEQLRSAGEGLGTGTKRLLEEPRLSAKLTPLYALVAAKPGMEAALATALEHYVDTLVVETFDDLKEILDYAEKAQLQGFSLLCREMASSSKQADALSLALQCEGEVAKRLLSHIVYAPELDQALQMAKENPTVAVCSRGGVMIDVNRVVAKTETASSNVFLREAELRSLGETIERLVAQLEGIEAEKLDFVQRLAAIDAECAAFKDQLRRAEMQSMEAQYAWQQAVSDVGKVKSEAERVAQAVLSAAESAQKLSEAVHQLRGQLGQAQEGTGEAQQRLAAIEEEVQQLQQILRSEKQSVQAEEVAYERLADENRRLAHTLSLLAVKDHESQIQQKRLETDIKHAKELQERLLHEENDHGVNLETVERRLERLLEAQKQTEDEVTVGRQRVEEAEQAIETESSRLKRREKEIQDISIQKAQQSSLLQAYALELAESHHIDVETQRDTLPELEGSLPESEQRVKALKEEVDRIANVNLTSIEDYEAQKVRVEGLGNQLDDLVTSQKELQQIIGELDDESRRLFTATFATIRSKFQEIFQILFRGGEADLFLTDEQDVLAAGIEILAKPPGKQMRSIHLMSGGEKCLTALALLFALFEVKPAPFCLLDEIDAPLDDSNVGRFADMLKHFVDRCQFIVITHNKCTMAAADVLVGVSMQEKGVSKVLTFDFAHHELAIASESS